MPKTPMQGYECPHCGFKKMTLEHKSTGGFFSRRCGGLIVFDTESGTMECSSCHEQWSDLSDISCLRCGKKIS